MHDEAIPGGVPCVGAGRSQIDDHARDRRILLELVSAYGGDLVGLDGDAFLLRVQPRVWQIDH